MVELYEGELRDTGRKSSKGNQLKWCRDDVWYKADYAGYEGLSEYIISHLLKKSSLSEGEYLLYDLESTCTLADLISLNAVLDNILVA